MNRTKIICTAGPSIDSEEKLTEIVEAGMSLLRLNCSHGDSKWRLKQMKMIRRVEKKLNQPIGVMVDLQGPKLRVKILEHSIVLHRDQIWKLSPKENLSESKKIIPVDFKHIAKAVHIGSLLFMDDGIIQTKVVKKYKQDVWVKIIHGGLLESRKGINIPEYRANHHILNSRDKKDLNWALDHGADFIALSFVRSAKDILDLRRFIKRRNLKHNPLVIAKIEKPEAVENMDAIIEVSDGILVARGDLGIELKPQNVPVVQKQLIEKCRFYKKPLIVATQMLDSMRMNPRPTRAEVSDVASSIYAGADAVMLTGETSSGKYPIEATTMLSQIIKEVEKHMIEKTFRKMPHDFGLSSHQESFLFNAMQLADDINAKAIVVLAKRGIMTKALSKLHPKQPIFSMTPDLEAARQLTLYWGVFSLDIDRSRIEKRIEGAINILKSWKAISKNHRILFIYRDFKSDNLNLKIYDL